MSRLTAFAPWLLLALAVGCGGGEDLGDPIDVSGRIQLDGKPLANATVQFFAVEGLPAEHRYAAATTDAEGRYSIAGLYPAAYRVSVVQEQPNAPEHVANPAPPALQKYGPESPLRAEVSVSNTTFDFDLNS